MSHRPHRALVAIVVLAVALRFAGLDFGLPLAEARPDEQTIAYQAMKFGRGDLNPHSFNYPSLFKYIAFVLFGADFAVGRALGRFGGQEDFLRSFFAADPEFRLLLRAFSALMGTAGVLLLAWLPGRLWGALVLAVCFLHVRDSHFGVTDITMVTLTTGAVLAATGLQARGELRLAFLAGGLAGLATSTKYNAALLAVPLVLAAATARGAGRIELPVQRRGRLAVVSLTAMAAGFALGTPYAVLDFPTFLKDFRYEASHLAAGHHVDVGVGWVHHAVVTLPVAFGWVGYPLGVLGIGLAFLSNRRLAAVAFSFPLVYFLLIGRGETAFFRYMLPVVPFLAMGAGLMLDAVHRRFGFAAAAVLALLSLASPTLRSLSANRLLMAEDTREAMGAWIEAHVPTDTVIVHAGAYTGAPMLQRNVPNQTREYAAKAGRADAGGFRKPDHMKWYRASQPMYDVQFVAKAGIDYASQVSVAELVANPPAWLEVESSGLTFYSAVPAELAPLLEARYELAHEELGAGPESAPLYDQQDALYLPAAGFRGVTRMGPNLRLYRLR